MTKVTDAAYTVLIDAWVPEQGTVTVQVEAWVPASTAPSPHAQEEETPA